MNNIIWHDAKKETPQEGQAVFCIFTTSLMEGDKMGCLAFYENSSFWNKYDCINRYKDNSIATEIHNKSIIEKVILWTDANIIFHSADKILNKIENKNETQLK